VSLRVSVIMIQLVSEFQRVVGLAQLLSVMASGLRYKGSRVQISLMNFLFGHFYFYLC